MRSKKTISIGIALLALAVLGGCYKGEESETQNPFVHLYNVPPDSSVMGAAPVIWWWGTDVDGIIVGYQWIDITAAKLDSTTVEAYYSGTEPIPDTVISADSADTFVWHYTESNADTIFLLMEPGDTMTKHLFCVRSIDVDGDTSDVECRIYYRTNEPPDSLKIKENEDYPEGDTFWVLNDTTWDWKGIKIDWTAHDPDKSIILEYYWWVENYDDPSQIVLTSRMDDSVLTSYSGENPNDGWVRATNTILRGPIPTGHWRFIIQVRDDAFEAGAADTFEFYAVHPAFDPSIDSVAQAMADTTYPHRMLVLFAPTFDTVVSNHAPGFYSSIFDRLVAEGIIQGYDTSSTYVTRGENLLITKFDLAQYSIIYLFNPGTPSGAAVLSPSEDMLDELRDYVLAGGRVVFDGRQFFNQISDFVNAPSPFGEIPFDMFGIVTQSDMGSWVEASPIPQLADEYPVLRVDSAKVSDGMVGGVRSMGMYPYFAGIPYAEPIYLGSPGDLSDEEIPDAMRNNILGRHLCIRYAKPNTRTALFAFPLFYARNDSGQVTTVLEKTFRFLITGFAPEEEDTTESSL